MSQWTEILSHVVTGGVAVSLGGSGSVFDSITFLGFRADGTTVNTSTVTVAPLVPISGVSSVTVAPGMSTTLLAPAGTTLTAAQFTVVSATALDGVVADFFSESALDWNMIESKVEEACELLVRTIPSIVADCTISRGFDVDTKTPNSVICICDSANNRDLGQNPVGNYDCKVKVRVTSQADSATDLTTTQALAAHWRRVARVRDAFLDENAPRLLSSSVALFYAFNSVREISTSSRTEDRHYVSELEFTVTCVGSRLV